MSNTLIAAMQSMQVENNENLRFVEVTFSTGSTRYTYKTVDAIIEEGDKVLVYTPSQKYEVVTVRKVMDADEVDLYAYRYAFIVQRVDTTQYDAMLENEETLLRSLRNRSRNAQARQAVQALMEGTTDEDQEKVKKLVRL